MNDADSCPLKRLAISMASLMLAGARDIGTAHDLVGGEAARATGRTLAMRSSFQLCETSTMLASTPVMSAATAAHPGRSAKLAVFRAHRLEARPVVADGGIRAPVLILSAQGRGQTSS